MLTSRWQNDLLTTAATKPIAGEITKETVKTIRVRECRTAPARPW
jgi:hypothetical protein